MYDVKQFVLPGTSISARTGFDEYGIVNEEDKVIMTGGRDALRKIAELMNAPCPHCAYDGGLAYEKGYPNTYWEPEEPDSLYCPDCGETVDWP